MVGSVKSMVVGFVLAAAVSCASLLGVALTAQQADAEEEEVSGSLVSIGSGELDEDSVEKAISNFFESTIGGHVKRILSLTGIVIVLFTLVKNSGNAVKRGLYSRVANAMLGGVVGGRGVSTRCRRVGRVSVSWGSVGCSLVRILLERGSRSTVGGL